MANSTDSPTYSISEAAALTGLHRNTIRQRIKGGLLEATVQVGKFGEEYRITRQALRDAGLLTEEPLREGPALDPDILDADGHAEGNGASRDTAPGATTVIALQELYQRHEQAMFRLGYMQGELERFKALADRAESLQEDNQVRQHEVQSLRAALDEKDRAASEAETLRQELERAREHLRELESVRRDLEHLKSLADQQEKTIGLLEATQKPWWRFW